MDDDRELGEREAEAWQAWSGINQERQQRDAKRRAQAHNEAWAPEVERLEWHRRYREQLREDAQALEAARQAEHEARHGRPPDLAEIQVEVRERVRQVFGG